MLPAPSLRSGACDVLGAGRAGPGGGEGEGPQGSPCHWDDSREPWRGRESRGAGGSLSGAGIRERGPCLIAAPPPHCPPHPRMGPLGRGLASSPGLGSRGSLPCAQPTAPCRAHQGRVREGMDLPRGRGCFSSPTSAHPVRGPCGPRQGPGW